MRRLLLLLTTLALAAAPEVVGAQDIHINPVPPGVKPQWTRVPGVPQVSWAPNLPTDVFRYGGKYYFYWADYFYRGPAPQGPWKSVKKVPEVFYQVDPAYFKTAKKAGEAPAAPAESTPFPKAKIIDVPPTEPPAQAPSTPDGPKPPGASVKLPKVM